MARAETPTKLSLDRWAAIMEIHPLHFNQVTLTIDGTPLTTGCHQPWLQHGWQSADRISREEIAMAIAQAEALIEDLLHYRLLPTWETNEWCSTIRPFRPELVNVSVTDVRGYPQIVQAKWRHFITPGIRGHDLIEANVDIDWGSTYPPIAYEDTGTVTVVTAVTDPCELRIYYPGKAGADGWEIRPINVTIAGGSAIITFRRELAVLESVQENLIAQAVDGTDDDNFLTTVDVGRVWSDPQTQATLMWEAVPGTCNCGDVSCAVCQFTVQTACLHSRGEPVNSLLAYTPADWDADENAWAYKEYSVGRQPDIVRIFYLAGLRDLHRACPQRQMDQAWERSVAQFAAALLDRPVCACANVTNRLNQWRADLAFSTGATELASYSMSKSDLDNPLGTTRGAVAAWKRVRDAAPAGLIYA